jgi:hypothetical protein
MASVSDTNGNGQWLVKVTSDAHEALALDPIGCAVKFSGTLTVVRSGWCRGKLLGTLTPIWTLSNHNAVRQRALRA